jgi:acetate kinase
MGTRSGDLDPTVLEFLCEKEGISLQEATALLNRQSGLLGVSGLTADMRDLLAEEAENDDRRARLAIDLFCHRVRKYVGAYLATLGGAGPISRDGSRLQAWVIPTDEELLIARDTVRVVRGVSAAGA